jgi:lipid-A-disaccharide synthase
MTSPSDPRRTENATGPLIFLIAGEPSGDALGASLMSALKRQTGGQARFAGVGGQAMIAEGLASLFPMSDLSVMGLFEILPRLPKLLGRVRETVKAIVAMRPDAVVTVDSPAFAAAVWRRLPAERPKLIHYVAPTVWAWRPGRARQYARTIDHLLTLFPFEPPYFEREGLAASFVGHPIVEAGIERADGAAFRRRHGVPDEAPLLCLLPGSRNGEAARLLPHFSDAVARLTRMFPALRVVAVAATPRLAETLRTAAASWQATGVVVAGDEKYDAMAASTVALAASGTVTLEVALAGVPMVVAYRVNPLTASVARRLIKVRHVCLVNLLAGRGVVPELLQEECRGEPLAAAVARLLANEADRIAQVAAAGDAVRQLRPAASSPSGRAAEAVLAVLRGSAHNPAQREPDQHEPGAEAWQTQPTPSASVSSTR